MLPSHASYDLGDVVKIVNDPGCEKLTQRDRAQLGVTARSVEIGGRDGEFLEALKRRGTQLGETAEQLVNAPAARGLELREAVERRKWYGVVVGQEVFHTGNPVGALAVNQVTHHIERAPRVGALGAVRPPIWKVAE